MAVIFQSLRLSLRKLPPRLAFLSLFAALCLAGCESDNPFLGGLYRPYQPSGKENLATARLALQDHIMVRAPAGLPEGEAKELAQIVAKRLVDEEIVATVTAPLQRTSVLFGRTTLGEPGSGRIDIEWTLRGPFGYDDNSFTVTTFSAAGTTGGPGAGEINATTDMSARADIAQQTVQHVIALMKPGMIAPRPVTIDAPEIPDIGFDADTDSEDGPQGIENVSPAPPVQEPQKRIVANENLPDLLILPAMNAPGDGSLSLSAALSEIMAEYDYRVVRVPTAKTFLIQSIVNIEHHSGYDRVEITWEMKDPDGEVVASLTQQNDVESNRLEGPWDEIAYFAAEGAAQGFIAVLVEVASAQSR